MLNPNREKRCGGYKKSLAMITMIILAVVVSFTSVETKAADQKPYLLKVNRKQNVITVYQKDKKGNYTLPIKAITCSTGGSKTPLGTFKTPEKYRWRLLMGNVWGQYSTRIKGSILFHSVWYYKQDPSTLSAVQYNKLGTAASAGCIRLTVEDAKWIHDNCPVGTTVTIYDGNEKAPLGKPAAITLPTNTGWDPTDPSSSNPWNSTKPVIKGAKSQTITYGATVNVLDGVTAKTSVGLYDTKSLIVKGKVNTKVPGKYKVTYSMKDSINRYVEKTVTFTVLENKTVPKLIGVKDQIVNESQKINKEFALTNVTATWDGKDITNKIQVTINKENDTTYKIKYSITASNKKSKSITSTISIDSEAPILEGVADREITMDQVVDTAYALQGVTALDNNVKLKKSKIKVTIKDEIGFYNVTYQVADAVGNEEKVTVKFVIIDAITITGAKDQTVTYDTIVDEALARTGVKVYLGDIDLTKELVVEISEMVNNQYIITYIINYEYYNEVTETVVITVNPNVSQ